MHAVARRMVWAGCLAVACGSRAPAAAISPQDWAAWRGPNGNGSAAAGERPPLTWSTTQNVVWKVPVPGRGHSSPTVVGDRIFLTTADEQAQTQSVLCFRRSDGKPLWSREVSRGGFPATHPKNTHASCTVACDGERLFATFHHHQKLTLTALSLDGEVLWERVVGAYHPQRYEYGYAASPLLYENLVIVVGDVETGNGGFLTAYERVGGKRVWSEPRPKNYSFSSPIVGRVAGQDQLLLSGADAVAAYNPKTGKLLWTVPGTTAATCGTLVWAGDLVFASGGYPKAETICVRGDGSKQVVWKNGEKCYEQSILVHDGHVYAVNDNGIAFCWRASDGQEQWKSRLGGPISASPMLVGDRIYQSNEAGTTFVFRADPRRFELLATNQLETEAFATPTFCGNRVYARVASGSGPQRQEHLYCLGE